MSLRAALLPVKHPLSYLSFSASEPKSATNGIQNLEENHDLKPKSSLAEPQTLEDRVRYLYEHQQITNLLNHYGYILDVCMVDHSVAQKWADLFTDDCDVTYPFGSHRGKEGLARWAMNAETRFHRMLVSRLFPLKSSAEQQFHFRNIHLLRQADILAISIQKFSFPEEPPLLAGSPDSSEKDIKLKRSLKPSLTSCITQHASSNFTITFDSSSDKIAHARTTLHAICGTDTHDLGKTFQEGGYYYWSFRKDESTGGTWKISYLFLDVNWTSGDSLGLNEPGAAD